ncbi:MAG: M48 family metalloprotease [Burkholderiales bacterium]|nr:M48 family metalloprotease [Burkholderiales bacterium]
MTSTRLRIVAVLLGLGLSAGAGAIDLDELRRAIEGPKKEDAQKDRKQTDRTRKEQPAAKGTAPAPQAEPRKKDKFDLGKVLSAVREISVEEEVEIGRQISGNLLGAAPLVRDDALQAYVNRVGRWIASQSGRADLKWTFGVIESPDINAFAAPGGYVFITRGLYARLQDEAQLAGVLAHEIAHVQEKHHLKVLQKQQLMSLGSEALSRKIEGEEVVQKLIGSGAEILARGLDKGAEFEADRVGVVLAARAGYDAFGLPVVLQDIGAHTQDASSVALLFKTHPHPDERLNALSEAMSQQFDDFKGRAPQRLVKLH